MSRLSTVDRRFYPSHRISKVPAMNKIALCLLTAAVFAIPSTEANAGFGCFGKLFSCCHKKSCCEPVCCEPVCCETTCCEAAPSCCEAAPTCCQAAPTCCEAAPSCCGSTYSAPSCCGGEGHSHAAPSGEVAPLPADMGPTPTPVAPAPPAAN